MAMYNEKNDHLTVKCFHKEPVVQSNLKEKHYAKISFIFDYTGGDISDWYNLWHINPEI